MVRRNILFVLMCLEVMMNAAALAFRSRWKSLGTGRWTGDVHLILTLAAAEASIDWRWCCSSTVAGKPWILTERER